MCVLDEKGRTLHTRDCLPLALDVCHLHLPVYFIEDWQLTRILVCTYLYVSRHRQNHPAIGTHYVTFDAPHFVIEVLLEI